MDHPTWPTLCPTYTQPTVLSCLLRYSFFPPPSSQPVSSWADSITSTEVMKHQWLLPLPLRAWLTPYRQHAMWEQIHSSWCAHPSPVLTCMAGWRTSNVAQISFVKDKTMERKTFLSRIVLCFALFFFKFAPFYFSFHPVTGNSYPFSFLQVHFRVSFDSSMILWKGSCGHVQKWTEKVTLELVPLRSKSDLETPSFLLLVSGGACFPKLPLVLTFNSILTFNISKVPKPHSCGIFRSTSVLIRLIRFLSTPYLGLVFLNWGDINYSPLIYQLSEQVISVGPTFWAVKWPALALSEYSRFGASSVHQRKDTVNSVWNHSWRHYKWKKCKYS